MRLFDRRTDEDHARAYCRSIGLDPDANVRGYVTPRGAIRRVVTQARWRWYLGVSEDALRRPI